MDLFSNKYIIGLIILVILLIVFLITSKPKKIKPILKTIDDVKEEKTEIEKVIESLETQKESRPMTTFEEEQEANAIISYQELVQAVKEKKALIEEHKVPAEEIKPNIEIALEKTEEKPKFKNSEFISPIFGKASNNDDFLKELKDFRSNL